MPSGKRQLRSASSESRNTSQSPLASGTYVRKETPGGLQSKTDLSPLFLSLLLSFNDFNVISVKNVWTNEDRKNGKNGKLPLRAQSPMATLQSVGNQNRPPRGASQHPSSSGSPLVNK